MEASEQLCAWSGGGGGGVCVCVGGGGSATFKQNQQPDFVIVAMCECVCMWVCVSLICNVIRHSDEIIWSHSAFLTSVDAPLRTLCFPSWTLQQQPQHVQGAARLAFCLQPPAVRPGFVPPSTRMRVSEGRAKTDLAGGCGLASDLGEVS